MSDLVRLMGWSWIEAAVFVLGSGRRFARVSAEALNGIEERSIEG